MDSENLKLHINNYLNHIFKYRVVLCFILFFILVLFKLHGSSIGIFNEYIQPYSNDAAFSYPLIGENRPIRSDEWAIHTPISLSQKFVNYNIYNDIIRAEKTNVVTLYSQPAKALFEVIKPFYWGYLILGDEYGLSWYWNGKLIFLFLVTFEFFLLITRRNKLLSLLGAFLIVYSPGIQWWFSTDLMEEIFWCELGIITIHNFLKTNRKLAKGLLSVVLGLCAAGFALCLYPAWMVPFSYTFIAILIWMIYENKNIYKFNKTDLFYLLISVIIAAVIILSLIISSSDVFSIMANTVHPGQRRNLGGKYILQLFYYLVNYHVYPHSNISEMSHFIGLFPLPALAAFIYLLKTKFKDKLCTGLLLVQALIVFYLVIGFSPLVAKITGFMMTTHRAVMVSSFIDVVLLLRLLSNNDNIKIPFKFIISLFYSLIVFIFVSLIKITTLKTAVSPDNPIIIIYPYLIAVIAFIAAYLILYGIEKNSKIKTFSVVLAILLSFICFSTVNPVMHGLNAVYEIPAGKFIHETQKNNPGRWLVVDAFPITAFPVIYGAPTINYTNIYPNLKLWHLIDKNRMYENVYNRYCNVSVFLHTDSPESTFKLSLIETIILYLSVDDLPKIGVDYIFSTIMSGQYINMKNGIELIPIYNENGAIIYRVNYTGEALKAYKDFKMNYQK